MPRASIFVPALAALAASATAPALAFDPLPPVDCVLGETCFLQNYVDRDPGPDAMDYRCGLQTYDAHKGTDIRVPDLAAMEAGVDVVAVADGRVLRARDGELDVSFREGGREAIAGRECGNALVIDHGDGWETQLCHLKQGSLLVGPGDTVAAGQRIAQVGLSGFTEFPHLHISFTKDGQYVDPLDPTPGADARETPPSCDVADKNDDALWSGPEWAYRTASIINTGFAAGPVSMQDIEGGAIPEPDADAAALVAYARNINMPKGDAQRFRLEDPDGTVLAEHTEPEGGRAQTMLFIGLRRPDEGWAPGRYRAIYEVVRGGEVVSREVFHHDM